MNEKTTKDGAAKKVRGADKRDKPLMEEQKKAMIKFLKMTLSRGLQAFLDEYKTQLKGYVPENLTKHAFDANPAKNRYRDVLCGDANRVVLKRPGTDYIHANFVRGKPLTNTFICAQGPIEATLGEWWRMMMQERVCFIFMLCDVIEDGRRKCAQYWPPNVGHIFVFGEVTVRNVAKDDRDPQNHITTLECSTKSEKMVLKHFHWKCWPDKSIPRSVIAPFRLLRRARHLSRPTVVHCSAGIGRTGTVIAIELCLQQILSGQPLPLLDIVKNLRHFRVHAVQTDLQFVYIAQCIMAFAFLHGIFESRKDLREMAEKFDADFKVLLAEKPIEAEWQKEEEKNEAAANKTAKGTT